MTSVFKVGLMLCFQFLFITGIVNAEITHHPTHVHIPKIQAAYWGLQTAEQGDKQLHLLKIQGLNSALVKDGGYLLNENLWQKWGNIAEKHGVQLFSVCNFAGPEEIKHLTGKYTPYTDRRGIVFNSTPCPLDNTYWSFAVGQRFGSLAHLSKTSHIAGAVFDTEMYGSDISIYQDLCFCDSCWKEFLRTEHQETSSDIAKEERFDYLVHHNLLQRYSDVQAERLHLILSSIEQQVHGINPNFLLGFLAYQDNWFYRGLIRGLGTTARPVMVFSETSYVRGYTPYVHQERQAIIEAQSDPSFANSDKHVQPAARYIPGLWLGRFFPEDIPAQLYNLAAQTDGYWIFTARSLWTAEQQPGPYALHGTNDEYWAALKQANDELHAFSQAPAVYQSSLPPIYQSSFYQPVQNRLVTQPALKFFLRNISLKYTGRNQNSNTQHFSKITYRGKALLHCFRKPENPLTTRAQSDEVKQRTETLAETIRITHVPIGNYTDETHYKLFDDKGFLLGEGSLNKQKPSIEMMLPPHVSGLVSLLLDSGANASQVFFSELPFVIEASATFPLATINTIQVYAFYTKPDQHHIKLRAYCSPGETALLLFQSPDNSVVQKYEITDFTEIRIPIPDEAFWKIAVRPIPFKTFEDVYFYFYNNEFPYLMSIYENPENPSAYSNDVRMLGRD
jgi:hypothetical protein